MFANRAELILGGVILLVGLSIIAALLLGG